MDDKEIVAAVRRMLAERIGKNHYDLLFRKWTRFEFASGCCTVIVSDAFRLERVRKYHHELVEVIGEVVGQPCQAVFRVDAALWESANDDQPTASLSPERGTDPATKDDTGAAQQPQRLRGRQLSCLSRFVVGQGNRVAHAAALSTVEQLGVFSPLFVYGPSGCGKTHLLQGICAAVRQQQTRRRWLNLSAEQFTTQFLDALQGSGLPSFRRKYRGLDLLLIDDVQFFAGKRATLVELQHTMDTLLREGRQIVLSADRPPSELGCLGPELTTRMAGGLVCGIEPAERETCREIVKRMGQQRKVRIPGSVIDLLADSLPGDARQLAGALNRLEACSQAFGQAITEPFAQSALQDILQATQRVVRLPDIDRAICDVFGLAPKSLQSSQKAKTVSHPRMLAMWLARKYTRAGLAEIGQYFGRRSHSTVISANKKVQTWMSQGTPIQLSHGDCSVTSVLRRIESRLRTG